jgi:hypothetical protein
MRIFLITLGIFFTFTQLSCKKEIVSSQSVIDINACMQRTFDNDQVRVCFVALVEDSRCPANANCVWQGVARARFTIEAKGEQRTFDLSTLDLSAEYRKERVELGYTIRLINIYPYPGLGNAPLQAEVELSK